LFPEDHPLFAIAGSDSEARSELVMGTPNLTTPVLKSADVYRQLREASS